MVPFWRILPFLARLLASLWLFWGACRPHFGALVASFALVLAVLGRLGAPFGPKLAQDNEKSRFFEFKVLIWDSSWEPKIQKNDVRNDVFFTCIFNIDLYRCFINFSLILDLTFQRFFDRFLDLK